MRASTGPKISSVAIRERGSVSSTTVGPDVPAGLGHVGALHEHAALCRRQLLVRTHALECVGVDQWSDHGGRVARMSDRHQLGRTREPLGQRVEDVVDRDDAGRRGTLLARVAERALQDRRHRVVEVGVGVDDDRVLAAHLRDDALDVPLTGTHLGRAPDDVEPDRLRSGERDERDVGMLDERGPDLLADTREERERARRETGFEQDLDEPWTRCPASAPRA